MCFLQIKSINVKQHITVLQFAFATAPFTLITYVELVMFAALRVSFAVIVMFRVLFTVARDVLALLLDIVKSTMDGPFVSITTLASVILSCATLNTFPVLSIL